MLRIRETYINKKLISINVTDENGLSIANVNIIGCRVHLDDRKHETDRTLEYATESQAEKVGRKILDAIAQVNETSEYNNNIMCETFTENIIAEHIS